METKRSALSILSRNIKTIEKIKAKGKNGNYTERDLNDVINLRNACFYICSQNPGLDVGAWLERDLRGRQNRGPLSRLSSDAKPAAVRNCVNALLDLAELARTTIECCRWVTQWDLGSLNGQSSTEHSKSVKYVSEVAYPSKRQKAALKPNNTLTENIITFGLSNT